MTRRTVLAAVLLTVLASSCNNKVWIDCTTTTVTRTKNKALNWEGPVPTTPNLEARSTC
jgi:hypothetical protein